MSENKIRPFRWANSSEVVELVAGPNTHRVPVGPVLTGGSTLDPLALREILALIERGKDSPFARAHGGWVRCDGAALEKDKELLARYGITLRRVSELPGAQAPEEDGVALRYEPQCMCGKPLGTCDHDE